MVCFDWGEIELCDETIEFIDDKDWPEAVLPCLTQDSDCLTRGRGKLSAMSREGHTYLRANAFHNIHEDERSVTQPGCRRDLTREIDVSGGIDNIDYESFRTF